VVSDSLVETDETFTVRLSNPTNAALASNTSAQATIVTDDLPSLSIRPTTPKVSPARPPSTSPSHATAASGPRRPPGPSTRSKHRRTT
jgi:hypothetical protein